jgi:putative redox protein
MECTVRWHEGMSFVAETGSGHMVCMDGAPEGGGRNLAPRPMELLLAGTGGCTALRYRADPEAWPPRGQRLRGEALRPSAPRPIPRCLRASTCTSWSAGNNLKPEAVERAVKLSAEKYCSASIMLGKTAQITHSFEVVEA